MHTEQKIFGLKDIIVITIAGNLGIRWIPVAAGIGPASLLFWFFGALFFFLPLAFIIAEFAKTHPAQGGIYVWVKEGLGERWGFITAWCYWINNFFYYPAILTFLVSNITYAVLRPSLANNELFVAAVVIATFWIITLALLGGLKVGKYFAEFGGILGTIVPFLVLIILGFTVFFVTHQSATSFTLASFIPNQGLIPNLSSLSMLMFAMAGIEVIATLANAVERPEKTLPRGLLISAFCIFLAYTIATVAMNLIATPASIEKTTGLMNVFSLIGEALHLPWLPRFFASLLSVAEVGALALWIIAPVVMFFNCTHGEKIPLWMKKNNSKNVPANALIFQAILVTVIILLTTFLPNLNDMYQVLVLMTTVVFFIPYVLLALSYLKLKHAGELAHAFIGKRMTVVVAGAIILSLVIGIAMCFVPPAGMTDKQLALYEIELIAGPVILIILGFYLNGRRNSRG